MPPSPGWRGVLDSEDLLGFIVEDAVVASCHGESSPLPRIVLRAPLPHLEHSSSATERLSSAVDLATLSGSLPASFAGFEERLRCLAGVSPLWGGALRRLCARGIIPRILRRERERILRLRVLRLGAGVVFFHLRLGAVDDGGGAVSPGAMSIATRIITGAMRPGRGWHNLALFQLYYKLPPSHLLKRYDTGWAVFRKAARALGLISGWRPDVTLTYYKYPSAGARPDVGTLMCPALKFCTLGADPKKGEADFLRFKNCPVLGFASSLLDFAVSSQEEGDDDWPMHRERRHVAFCSVLQSHESRVAEHLLRCYGCYSLHRFESEPPLHPLLRLRRMPHFDPADAAWTSWSPEDMAAGMRGFEQAVRPVVDAAKRVLRQHFLFAGGGATA